MKKKIAVIPDTFINQLRKKVMNEPYCDIHIKIRDGKPTHCRIIPDFKPIDEK